MLIKVTRAGLNFADTHTRTNSYVQKATLPLVPGGEVAGVREDTGERVVALVGSGGYAEYAIAPSDRSSRSPTGSTTGPRWRCSSRERPRGTCIAPPGGSRDGESVVVHGAAAASARSRCSSATSSAPGA